MTRRPNLRLIVYYSIFFNFTRRVLRSGGSGSSQSSVCPSEVVVDPRVFQIRPRPHQILWVWREDLSLHRLGDSDERPGMTPFLREGSRTLSELVRGRRSSVSQCVDWCCPRQWPGVVQRPPNPLKTKQNKINSILSIYSGKSVKIS